MSGKPRHLVGDVTELLPCQHVVDVKEYLDAPSAAPHVKVRRCSEECASHVDIWACRHC